jgi:hypothetical protein
LLHERELTGSVALDQTRSRAEFATIRERHALEYGDASIDIFRASTLNGRERQ